MLLRLAYLGVTNVFALLRLLPRSDHDKDTEILVLRHQLAMLQRQLNGQRIRFEPADRAWLAALLHRVPRPTLRSLRLLVQPDRREEQELSVLCLRVLQAALVYVNTLMLQDVLADEDWATALTDADRRGLTPLFWTHVAPYGEVKLDMSCRLVLGRPAPAPA